MKTWTAASALLLVSAPGVVWACGGESFRPPPRFEELVLAGVGAGITAALVLLPWFLLGHAGPRCRACRGRTSARWTEGMIECAGCRGPLEVKGPETYHLIWLASAAISVALAYCLWRTSLLQRSEQFVFAAWLLGFASAALAGRLVHRRVRVRLPRASVVGRADMT
jgi:uncharacterized membrane protein